MNDLNEETKKIIRSILLSTPLKLTLKELQKDYYDLIGSPIPFEKLGFRSLENYLHTLPDIVKISGGGCNAILQGIENDKTAHIKNLVLKQRITKKKKKSRHDGRRNIFKYNYLPTHPVNSKIFQKQSEEISIKRDEDVKIDKPKDAQVNSSRKSISEKTAAECGNACLATPIAEKLLLPIKIKDEPTQHVEVLLEHNCPDHHPEDTVCFGKELPKQQLPNSAYLASFVVNVGEVYDISKWWFIINSDACSEKLYKMMDNMQLFYKDKNNYIVPECNIKVGLYCSTLFYDEHHRAVVVGFVNNNIKKVKVFFFDFGTVYVVSSDTLYYLRKDFFSLPMQAIRGTLAGICPPKLNTPWCMESSNRFLNLVTQKNLLARIDSRVVNRDLVQITLIDSTNGEDVSINELLVQDGYAIYSSQKQEIFHVKYKPIVKNIHLYPTFDDLENGNVPTASEILLLGDVGLNYVCHEYYENFFLKSSKVTETNGELSESLNLHEYSETCDALFLSQSSENKTRETADLVKINQEQLQGSFAKSNNMLQEGGHINETMRFSNKNYVFEKVFLSKILHIILYENAHFLSVKEAVLCFLDKIVPIYMIKRTIISWGHFIPIVGLDLTYHPELKIQLERFQLTHKDENYLFLISTSNLPLLIETLTVMPFNFQRAYEMFLKNLIFTNIP